MKRVIPKPTSAALKKLQQRVMDLLPPAAMHTVLLGCLDKVTITRLAAKTMERAQGGVEGLRREELVSRILIGFATLPQIAHDTIRALDQVTEAERTRVSRMSIEEATNELGSIDSLRLRREGARFVWALVRDRREPVQALAERLMSGSVEEAQRLEEARSEAKRKGAARELAEFEQVYRDAAERVVHLQEEFSAVEREKAQLAAEIGRQKAALRKETERRRALSRTIRELEDKATPHVAPPVPNDDQTDRNRLRKLENTVAALKRQNEQLREEASRAQKLEDDNERLRAKVASLREERASVLKATRGRLSAGEATSELPAPETMVGSRSTPVVAPPKPPRVHPMRADARVGVFVDVANLAGAARRLHGRAVDFRRLYDFAAQRRRVMQAMAFAIDKGGPGYDAFAHALREAGYKVFSKKPKRFADGTVKADWDVGIAVEAMRHQAELDVVVIGTGDGDFVPLVRALQATGVRVEIAAFEARAASELLEAADYVFALGEEMLES